jgi:predicted DnaQ family exonuclease/DinG family helicase
MKITESRTTPADFFTVSQNPVVAIDIETTGLSYRNDEIIEIGAIRMNPDGTTETFESFVKPSGDVPLFIHKLTGITINELKTAEKPKKVLQKFCDFLKPVDVIVCHNAPFDINFLNHHIEHHLKCYINNPVIDTLTLSRIFLPHLSSHSLSSLVTHFDIPLTHAHRALYDAQATLSLLHKLTDFIIRDIKAEDISFMVTVCEYSIKIEKSPTYLHKKEQHEYLLRYLSAIRDEIVKYALIRTPSTESPLQFSAYNFIDHKKTTTTTAPTDINAIFSKNGAFSRAFSTYECRDGQVDMSNAVLSAFQRGEYLLVEAGTGVGKSLAYLVAALLFSQNTGNRVVVSTNTKNLQEQLMYKDIPLLAQALDTAFSAVLVKGRGNYLCKRKWTEIYEAFTLRQSNVTFSSGEAFAILYLYLWVKYTRTGDSSENHSLANSPYSYIFKRFSSDRHQCFGRKCRFFGTCFLMEVRQRAETANIVIINHSLLFSDIQNEQATLGDIDYLIFDEAHNLLQSVAEYLGFTMTIHDIIGFIGNIHSIKRDMQSGMLSHLKTATIKSMLTESQKESLVKSIDTLQNFMDTQKSIVEKPFCTAGRIAREKGTYSKYRIVPHRQSDFMSALMSELACLQNCLKKINQDIRDLHLALTQHESKHFPDQELYLDLFEKFIEKGNQYIRQLDELCEPNLEKYAFWLSVSESSAGEKNTSTQIYQSMPDGMLSYAPIQINEIMPDVLYRKVKSIIYTSATMSLKNGFKYYVSNMGLDKLSPDNPFGLEPKTVREQVVKSPFDYDKQTLIVNTGFLPNVKDSYFALQATDLIKNLLIEKPVGTLVLFTSYADLKSMYQQIEQTCYEKNILLLAQGISGSRNTILNNFKADGNAVLLGTSSFWEGIDVPGDSLKLLILYKLPFQVPTDPLVEAYLEKLEGEGKNSFMYYSLPNALLKMRQGIGRLIRSKSDKGAIIILDNRISQKDYGQHFRDIVPTKIHTTHSPVETIDMVIRKLS